MHKPSGELYKIGDTPTLSDFIVYVTGYKDLIYIEPYN